MFNDNGNDKKIDQKDEIQQIKESQTKKYEEYRKQKQEELTLQLKEFIQELATSLHKPSIAFKANPLLLTSLIENSDQDIYASLLLSSQYENVIIELDAFFKVFEKYFNNKFKKIKNLEDFLFEISNFEIIESDPIGHLKDTLINLLQLINNSKKYFNHITSFINDRDSTRFEYDKKIKINIPDFESFIRKILFLCKTIAEKNFPDILEIFDTKESKQEINITDNSKNEVAHLNSDKTDKSETSELSTSNNEEEFSTVFVEKRISDETLLNIFKYLSFQDLGKLGKVSIHWKRILSDNSLWEIKELDIKTKQDFLNKFSKLPLPKPVRIHLFKYPHKIKKLDKLFNENSKIVFKTNLYQSLSQKGIKIPDESKEEWLDNSFILCTLEILSLNDILLCPPICFNTGFTCLLEELISAQLIQQIRTRSLAFEFNEKIKIFNNKNLLTALREKLITDKEILEFDHHTIAAILSDIALAALRKKIIKYEQIILFKGYELNEILTEPIIEALEHKLLTIEDIRLLKMELKEAKSLNYKVILKEEIEALSLKLLSIKQVHLLPFYIEDFGKILIAEYKKSFLSKELKEEQPNSTIQSNVSFWKTPSNEDSFLLSIYACLPALTIKIMLQHPYLKTAMQAHIQLSDGLRKLHNDVEFEIKKNSKKIITLMQEHNLPIQLFAIPNGLQCTLDHLNNAALLLKNYPFLGEKISADKSFNKSHWLDIIAHADQLITELKLVGKTLDVFFQNIEAVKLFANRYPHYSSELQYSVEDQKHWLESLANRLDSPTEQQDSYGKKF